ncbi:MAG: class I SAM-dependent methyltransferase [Dehalococcoidia bacterium]
MDEAAVGRLAGINWADWYRRWERQQGGYISEREARFGAMFSAVAHFLGEEFVAVDVASGPGGLTRRLAERFPKARVFAVDLDPVLLAIGRQAVGAFEGRVTWVQADLNDPNWVRTLPVTHVDAALSTTAIHWLSTGSIAELYRTLADLIRPGGVFADGDQMRFPPSRPALRTFAEATRAWHRDSARAAGVESWEEWWSALRQEAALGELFAERDRLFAWRGDVDRNIGSRIASGPSVVHTGYELHRAALTEAGFGEVETIWQHLDDRLLLAIR